MPECVTPDDPGEEHEPVEREVVRKSQEFQQWRDQLPNFELDDERLYLPSGDIPMDEDQLVDYWVGLTRHRRQEGNQKA